MKSLFDFASDNMGGSNTIVAKIKRIEWGMVFILFVLAVLGTVLMYGASKGSWEPWALDHITRFFIVLVMMVMVAIIDIKIWYHLAYPAFAIAFILILGVEFFGEISKGAQRWIRIGPVRMQPSEFMKIAVILALARYYQDNGTKNFAHLKNHIIPLILILLPTSLIMHQPDLGTGATVAMVGAFIIMLVGISWRYIFAAIGSVTILAFVSYHFLLHDFQRQRIITFLNPELDRSGEGYQITQSKIAIGSGGFFGVGYMQGTQSKLDFLPERHTDFVFAMLLEEFGMFGGIVTLLLFFAAMAFGLFTAISSRHYFGKILAAGVTVLLFIYVSINAAMIMGLLPVVGMPMPFLSYGGSVMLSVMFAIGLLQNVRVHRDKTMGTGFSSRE